MDIKWIRIINNNKNKYLIYITLLVYYSDGQLDVPSLSPIRSGSQCFHVKGVPTLKMRCPNGELIRIVESFYGTPIGGEGDAVCEYKTGENHCLQLMDMQENCMGRYMCSIYVSNPFLMNCRTYASYMQVNYTCVPRYAIHNICEPRTITTSKGYIRSPHYPDANYTSNSHCGCRLETKDKGLLLNLLDFSVNHTQQSQCDADFLRVGHWGRKCGKIGPERLPETLKVDTQTVNLEFHSDKHYNSRGFWMEFAGLNGGEVTMSCGHILHEPSTVEVINGEIKQELNVQYNNLVISTLTDNTTKQTNNSESNLSSTKQSKSPTNSKVNLFIDKKVYDLSKLKNPLQEITIQDQKQSLSIHPKHLDTVPFFKASDLNMPFLRSSSSIAAKNKNNDFISYQTKYQSSQTEIDLSPDIVLDTYQEQLQRQLDASPLLTNDDIKATENGESDTVYTPHDGPWDIPGADGSSINNVVIKGDWNDGEEMIDIQHALLNNVYTDPQSSSNNIKDKLKEEKDDSKTETEYNMVYGVDPVQLTTGIVVGFLILIAVIIIIVLVFRRYPSRF